MNCNKKLNSSTTICMCCSTSHTIKVLGLMRYPHDCFISLQGSLPAYEKYEITDQAVPKERRSKSLLPWVHPVQ